MRLRQIKTLFKILFWLFYVMDDFGNICKHNRDESSSTFNRNRPIV